MADRTDFGDLDPEELRAALHRAADHIADYLSGGVESSPVLAQVEPGDLTAALPSRPPEQGEGMDALLDDYRCRIEPAVTHWNHPGFHAYFAISGSGPGVVAEALSAALNVNAMLWRSGPAATELEVLTCDWLRQMMGLPETFRGHINDTASSSTLVALAAARESLDADIRRRGAAGRDDLAPLVVYTSDQAHSSIDKAAIVLGLGTEGVRRIPSDAAFRMDPGLLAEAVAADRAAGRTPMAVVATTGTTSTSSIDPLPEIVETCRREQLWLHVDAAYGGAAAIVPELRPAFAGMEHGDSLVVNPHKWLFVPVDCSVLFVRDEDLLKRAFSLVPEYLKSDDGADTNLMDLGFQLGRRFRALKLWMVIRAFGVEGLARRIRHHCELARELAAEIEAAPGYELAAPVPLALVCFRATADDLVEQDRLNERLMAELNATGRFFLSHTRLDGRFTLRVAIGNIRTERRHLADLWQTIQQTSGALRAGNGPH
ncbi:MAG: pyridoxal-dependent decarboxylase [Acidobacteriota bacterium]